MNATTTSAKSPLPASRESSRSGLDMAEVEALVMRLKAQLATLSGASILITGATGWFGVWLVDTLCTADDLLQLGIRITAVSRNPERFLARFSKFGADPRIKWIESDVRGLGKADGGFSHVIHAAADNAAGADPAAQLQLHDTIVEGTRRTIAAAGTACTNFLFLSSGAIYGPARRDCARFEEYLDSRRDPSSPPNAYADAKRAAELICHEAAASGLGVRIARCFAFVGPHMPFDKHFAIGNFIADAVGGRPIRVKSDGRALRSYAYMTDLVHALIAILVDGAVGRPYNVGSEESVTIAQLAHRVDRVAGGRGVVIEGAPSDPGDRYVPDTTRLHTELGWLAEVALDTAIARTAAWYRARPTYPVTP